MVVMAPADANDIGAMLDFSLSHNSPCCMRYPKATAAEIERELQPVELGKAEIISWDSDGTIIAAGTTLVDCLQASEALKSEGLDVGVVSARFVKPMDLDLVRKSLTETGFVVTVEEAMLMGGFGSAFLEAANELGLDTTKVHRIGIPDVFVEHGDRRDLQADLRLDANGIAETCRDAAQNSRFQILAQELSVNKS